MLLAIYRSQAWELRLESSRRQVTTAHANGCKHRGSNGASVRSVLRSSLISTCSSKSCQVSLSVWSLGHALSLRVQVCLLLSSPTRTRPRTPHRRLRTAPPRIDPSVKEICSINRTCEGASALWSECSCDSAQLSRSFRGQPSVMPSVIPTCHHISQLLLSFSLTNSQTSALARLYRSVMGLCVTNTPYVISRFVGTLVNIARLHHLLLFDMIIYLCAAPAPSAPLSIPPTRVNTWRRIAHIRFLVTVVDVTADGIGRAKWRPLRPVTYLTD